MLKRPKSPNENHWFFVNFGRPRLRIKMKRLMMQPAKNILNPVKKTGEEKLSNHFPMGNELDQSK